MLGDNEYFLNETNFCKISKWLNYDLFNLILSPLLFRIFQASSKHELQISEFFEYQASLTRAGIVLTDIRVITTNFFSQKQITKAQRWTVHRYKNKNPILSRLFSFSTIPSFLSAT